MRQRVLSAYPARAHLWFGFQDSWVATAQGRVSISFGNSVKKAFLQAKALLMLEGISEENTPELFVKEGLDAANIFLVEP